MLGYRLSIYYLIYFLHCTSQVEWSLIAMPTLQIQHPRHREVHDPLLTFSDQVESWPGFPVVLCGRESWTKKKAENQRTDVFELCWKRLLRVPWTARRSNQSILKEINPEYSLEGLMLKLKLQYFGHLMQRANSLEKILMLGKIEGGRRRGQNKMRYWMASLTQWTWAWVVSTSWWRTGKPGVLQTMGSQRVRHRLINAWATAATTGSRRNRKETAIPLQNNGTVEKKPAPLSLSPNWAILKNEWLVWRGLLMATGGFQVRPRCA